MRIEKIRINAAAAAISRIVRINWRQSLLQELVCVVAVEQPGPQIDLPCQTPARADIAPRCQTRIRSGKKIRSSAQSNLIAGKQSVQVRYMAMLSFRRFQVPIFQPLL